jgi:hypothetical protein
VVVVVAVLQDTEKHVLCTLIGQALLHFAQRSPKNRSVRFLHPFNPRTHYQVILCHWYSLQTMARGKKVEPHVASLIKIYLDAGRLSCVQIAKELGLSSMTIYRIRLNYDLYNAPYPPSVAKKGRPQAFTPEQQAVSQVSIDAFWLLSAFCCC